MASGPLIPQPDPTFVWSDPARDVTQAVEHNERVFLYSPSSTGRWADITPATDR